MQHVIPECPICGSSKTYEFSGIVSKYVQCRVCMAKWQCVTRNKELTGLILHELPKDGSAVYTITSEKKKSLFSIIGTRLSMEFWKVLKLSKEIDWDTLANIVSPEISAAAILEKGERLLYQWDGTREIREKRVLDGNTVEAITLEVGTLLLSTQRLRWLAKRTSIRGFLKMETSVLVLHEILLDEIRGISGETGNSHSWNRVACKRISIVDGKGENIFNLHFAFLEVLRPMIIDAIEARKMEIDAEKKRERLQVMLDFSFLKTYMEKGGLVMQTLKCPECSASVEFPKSGRETKCVYCGKTIYAQDIFEKVKSLLE